MKKTLLIISVLLLTISCGSSKNRTEQLDKIAEIEKGLNYTIDIPKTWKPFYSHGVLNYTDRENKHDNHKSYFYVSQIDKRKNKNYDLDTFTLDKVKSMSKIYDKFDYNIIAQKSKFGILFIVNSTSRWRQKNYKTVSKVFEYKGYFYILNYRALVENFDKNINEVEQIFSTFKIKEGRLKQD